MGGGGGKGGGDTVVGYKYFVGMHMVFCEEVDSYSEIKVGEKRLYGSSGGTSSENTDYFYVKAPELFGGEDKQGGVVGLVEVAYGRANQGVIPYLRNKISGFIGQYIPAFRGVFSLVLHQVYVSARTPYLKPWWVRVKRQPAKGWYDAKADIGEHANPAHILYEIFDEQGIVIDDTSFRAAADTLYNEGFGLSFLWKGGNLGDFVDEIMTHIAGFLYVHPRTGKMYIKLIRNDYDINNLPLFDESNIKQLKSYKRRTLSETVNQITIIFKNADNDDKDESVTIQDLGNIQAQGKVVNQDVRFPGIPSHGLASRVAQREVSNASSLLSTVEIETNREGYNLTPGDVFVLNWDSLGLSQIVYRVVDIDYGVLQNGAVLIKAIEDVYSLPDAAYTEAQAGYWVDPVSAPAPCPIESLVELPYWDVARNSTDADLDYLPIDVGYMASLGSKPSGDAYNYFLYSRMLSGDWTSNYKKHGGQSFAPTAALDAGVDYDDTNIALVNMNGIDTVVAGDTKYAYLGDEIVRIDSVDAVAGTMTIGRGCLDTVPKAHGAGTALIVAKYGFNQTQYIDGTQIFGKLAPTTGKGQLALADAVELSLTFDARFARPYPPAYLTINTKLLPAEIIGNMNLAWRHRNRQTETAYLVDDTEASLSPETGTTYTYEIRKASDNTLLKTGTVSGDNVSVLNTDVNYDGDVTVTLWSERDGYQSWQSQVREFQYWRTEPRETETGKYRTTESGIQRIVED